MNREKLIKKQERKNSANYAKADSGHWMRRTIKAMKDSPRVIQAVTEGKFDAYLKRPGEKTK